MTKKSVMLWLSLVVYGLCQPAWAQVPADAVWIDVRSPTETAGGHLPQAELIPFDGIEVGVAELQISKDRPIYLYCGSGRRAESAKERLEAQGYTAITNVGGLEDAQKLVEASPVKAYTR